MLYLVDNFVKKLDKIRDNIGEGYIDAITILEYLNEISDLVKGTEEKITKRIKEKI